MKLFNNDLSGAINAKLCLIVWSCGGIVTTIGMVKQSLLVFGVGVLILYLAYTAND